MALIALRKDLPGPNIKSRKEIDGAMAEILKFLALAQPWTQGQGGVQASDFRLSGKACQMGAGAREFLRFAKLSGCDRSRV